MDDDDGGCENEVVIEEEDDKLPSYAEIMEESLSAPCWIDYDDIKFLIFHEA